MLQPTRIVAPIDQIMSLAEAKAHLRVDSNDEDALITNLISVATDYLDGFSGVMGRALAPQTWRDTFRCFHLQMKLRVPPVQSVSSINYVDSAGNTQQVPANDYQLLTGVNGSWIEPKFGKIWPVPEPRTLITIDYVTGSASMPATVKQAALLLIGHWFENRQAVGTVSGEVAFSVSALLAPISRVGI